MTSPYARLIMFVIPNCIVNPTAAMAITDMLTRPKPNAATKRFTAFGSWTWSVGVLKPAGCSDSRRLFRGQLPELDLVALGVIVDQDVAGRGVVVLVEVVLAAGADETDGLARLESVDPILICADHRGSGCAV